MAQSPDQMFRLDPREVKVVAPVSEFTAQTNTKVVDTSLADKSRSRGFADLGTSLLNAGIQKKNEQVVEDTRIAQEAAAREEVMPGGLYPIAQQAYRDAIDINTSHATLLEAKNWTDGTEYTNILKDKGLQQRQKTDALKNHLAQLREKALGTLQNPQVIQKLNHEFDELIAENEKIVYEYEKDQRDLTIIEAGTNTVLSAVSFAKRGELLWDTVFTPRFLKNMTTDVLKIAPDMLPAEAKILSFKIIANNPDLLGRPSVMRKLLSTEFSDGISFATLLSKGSVPNRTTGKVDPDAKQFAAVWEEYQTNARAYSASIAARNKELKEIRTQHINNTLLAVVENGGGTAEAKKALKTIGITKIAEYNTLLEAFDKFNESEKFGIDSKIGQAFERSLAGTNATAAEVKLAMIKHGISLNNVDYYQTIASVENTQVNIVRDAHTAAIKIVKSQSVSMLKGALEGKTLFDANGEPNRKAIRDLLFKGKKLNSIEVFQVLKGLQAIDLEFSARASKTARSVAAADNLMDTGELVNKFQNDYFERLEKFIEGVQAGNLVAPDSSTGKSSADKETSTGTPTKDKPKNPIVEQHEVLKKLTPETIEEQKKIIAEDFKASIGEQGKNKLNKPVYTLNSKDEEYYKTVAKGMSEEQTRIVSAQKFASSVASTLPVVEGRTLTGEDIFDVVTKGQLQAKTAPTKSRTGLGPVVDAVDATVGAVVDWLQDKPQTKHEVESTVQFLEIFKGLKGSDNTLLGEDFSKNITRSETPVSDTQENLDVSKGFDDASLFDEDDDDSPSIPKNDSGEVDAPELTLGADVSDLIPPIQTLPEGEVTETGATNRSFGFMGDTDKSGSSVKVEQSEIAFKRSGATKLKDSSVVITNTDPDVLDITNSVYKDKTLIKALRGTNFEQGVVTDAFRPVVKPGQVEGAHHHDNAADLRARNIVNETDAKKVTEDIVKSLTKSGYTIVKAKNGSKTVTKLHDNPDSKAYGMPQVWTMFTKDNKTFMLEVDTGFPHIHFQSGTDYDTTREIAKKWPKN
jgi:hypothetical protein